jgi:polysaccharide biosynthesis/export protein
MFDSISRQFFGKRSYRASSFMISLLLASSWSLPLYAQQSPPASNQATSNINGGPLETEYTLGAGDRIRVDIFQVEELSGEYVVLVDGSVSFPLIGNQKVEGLTVAQLNAMLAQKYAAYLKRPIVTIGLLSPRPLKVAIAGEVNRPGSYTMNFGEQGQKFPSVTDLIQQAGGITTTADVGQVQIRRVIQGRQQVVTLDMWQLIRNGNQGQNIALRDGDSVVIPTKDQLDPGEIRDLADANFGIQADRELDVAVVGEVYRPGTHKISPDRSEGNNGNQQTGSRTQLEPPRLSRAIQVAGGIKPLADVRRIEVRRFTRTGKQQTIAVDLWGLLQSGDLDKDVILQDGDTIVIPTAQAIDPKESESLAAASFSPDIIRVNVVGEVKTPGTVEVPPNTPLNQALLAAGGFDDRRANKDEVTLIRLNPNGTVSKRQVPVDFSSDINDEKNPTLRNNDVVVVDRSGLASTTDTLGTVLAPIGSIFGLGSIFRLFN